MDIQSLERQILLRHRSEGHVRFSLPPALCTDAAMQLIRRRLLDLDGVYRVDCFPNAHKLAIRYQSVACSLGAVARRLREAVHEAVASGAPGGAAPVPPQTQPTRAAPLRRGVDAVRWLQAKGGALRERAHEWRAKAIGFTHYAKARAESDSRLPKGLDERTVINFLNDIAALYLVKIHWDLITKRWTQAPFTYRYEWLTVFYLVFLLVRSRKQALKK